jgi:serine/threonine-protein kinase
MTIMDKMIANRYMIVKTLGHGGMADVYVAMDTLLNREVAIKILKGELSSDPVALIRFQREATASTALSHPNIVDIYDVGEDKGKHYIVMEYVRGLTLKELITKRGALMIDEAIYFVKQLAEATACAHNKGLIHRDIKPQNVLMKDDGTLKMADFGISLAENAIQLTGDNSVLGSVHYLAPEISKGEPASFQSDIYALGIVLFELLTGDVPYKADQAVRIALMHIREDIPSIVEMNPSIPQSVENIIIKATAKNKKFRYQNCQEMINDLQVCLSDEHKFDSKAIIEEEVIQAKTKVIPSQDIESKPKPQQVFKKEKKSKAKSFIFSFIGLITLAVSAIAIIAILYLSGILNLGGSNIVIMPDITNKTVSQATQILENFNLIIDTNNINRELTEDIEEGIIIYSYPLVNAEIEKGTTISIVVSKGIYATMANYVGSNINDAIKDLKQYAKVRVIDVSQQSDTIAPGMVISQELLDPNEKFDPDKINNIKLIYSEYAEMVIPYKLKDMNISEAKSYLESNGMKVILSVIDTNELTEEQKAELQYGVVNETSPSMGVSYTQEDGNYITLYYY